MNLNRTPTPREFCAVLRATGCDADPDEYAFARGDLLDGRGWILGDPADERYDGPDVPMPEPLFLAVYESETENAPHWPSGEGLEFNTPIGMVPGCTAKQAADAIRRADSGSYSAFAPVTMSDETVPPMRAARPVEGTLTADGVPVFGTRAREYLRAVRRALPQAIAPWKTGTCPECGRAARADGVDFTADEAAAHVTIRGAVVLGCGGYFVVDHTAVGLEPGSWQDWREQPGPPAGADEERADPRQDRPGLRRST